MKTPRKWIALTIAALLLLAAPGCSGTPAATEASESTESAGSAESAAPTAEAAGETSGSYRDELHIAMSTEPTNLDVTTNTATVATQVAYGTIFEGLVTMDSSYGAVPELCESWEISDDSTQYTWHLRQGVLFHNGEEMTAEDAAASLNRWLAAAGNAQSMIGDATFEAADTYTVTLTMENPCAYVNELMAGLGQRAVIMPKSVLDAVDETGVVTEYIGTGPYEFVEWAEHQYIHITRNDDYQPYGTDGEFDGWGGYKNAYTKDIYFDIVSDSATIVAGMQTGEYDATTAVTADNIALFQDNADFNVVEQECEMAFLIFNKAEGLGADETMRQAIQAAVNADDIMLGVYGDDSMYTLYSSYMFSNITDWYTEAGSEFYNQNDAERAQELLAEAGYTGEEPFRILIASDSPDFYSMAVILQNQLEAVGINTEILSYDWATFVSVRNDQPENYDAFITSFSPKILPTMNLYLSSTWAGWVDDERILEDLAAISADTSKENAVQTWVDLQQYMYETSVPVVKFGSTKTFLVASKDVEGLALFEHIVYANARVAE